MVEKVDFTYWKQITRQNTMLRLIIMKDLKKSQNMRCNKEDQSEKQILKEIM